MKNEKIKLKSFSTLLRNNKENIINYDKLCLKRKNKQFTEFVALNLRCKFGKIKFNCSLKFYAKNVRYIFKLVNEKSIEELEKCSYENKTKIEPAEIR